MKTKNKKERMKMKFLSDLSFNLSSEEVWEDLCSHTEKEKEESTLPIQFHILRSLNDIGSFLNKKNCIQMTLF